MLKSLQFVDPLLAQRIHNLQLQLTKLQSTKQEIQNNHKLLKGTKEKLIKYNIECQQTTKRMLNQQRDKLSQYIDQQTNIITKVNRQFISKQSCNKSSYNLNQSTRIDLSIDDSKSIQINHSLNHNQTSRHQKISSFFVTNNSPNKFTIQNHHNRSKIANRSTLKIKNLNKKVQNQSKLIKMLIDWIKIYHQRQNQYQNLINNQTNEQQYLKQQNIQLRMKIDKLQRQLSSLKTNFKNTTNSILQSQQKYDQIREENSGLMFQRKVLINQVQSCRKYNKKAEVK